MVKGYTANEYGDFLIASIKDPYTDVEKVLDWNILVGLSDLNTIGRISLDVDSVNVYGSQTNFSGYQSGDKIIVGNNILTIDSVVNANHMVLVDPSPITAANVVFYKEPSQYSYFEYEYRFSQIQGDGTYSEFRPLTKDNNFGDLFYLDFDPRKPLYIDVKCEVAALLPANSLTILSITYTLQRDNGIIESCPQFCTDCLDPYLYNGCANIRVNCDDTNQFQPYNLGKSQQVYLQLSNMVSDIFGHQVKYFRTEPDQRTKDVILMEYSLFHVADEQTIKILVPDNEFPQESSISYDMFGMDFEEFEIHIVKKEFEEAFGYGKQPRNKDYMFIPIINKMYTVSSVSLGDRFNAAISYWKLKLTKYSTSSAVETDGFTELTDMIVTGIDEVFGAEIKDVQEQVTKPEQYQTVSTSYRDGIRQFQSKDIKIVDYDLKNRWTVVSKNYYDLTQVDKTNVALEYVKKSNLKATDDFALTAWISPQFETANNTEDYFVFGDYALSNGFRLMVSPFAFTVIINGIPYTYAHNMIFAKDKWYAFILNASNTYRQLSLHVYALDANSNEGLPQLQNNDLIPAFHETKELNNAMMWNSDTYYHLNGAKLHITNIRMFEKPIELEQHHNVLNQYVVRDNQLALIIDNAIPSIGFQKFKNAR